MPRHDDLELFLAGKFPSHQSSEDISEAMGMDNHLPRHLFQFLGKEANGIKVVEALKGSMEQRDAGFFEHRIDSLCVAGKGFDIPSLIVEMPADVESIALNSTPAVSADDMYKGGFRGQLVAASITLISTLGRLRKEPISLSTSLPW